MPILGTHRLTDAEIPEAVLIPDSFFALFNAVNDFVEMFTISNFLPQKINFNLSLPKSDLRHDEIVFSIPSAYCSDNFGLNVSVEGRFLYQGSPLKHISLNSKHGMFLSKLLKNDDNYVSDEKILDELNFEDYRNLGYIKRDMKKALKQDGLEVTLYRARGMGYKLLALTPITPQ